MSKPSARTAWPRPSDASSDRVATRCQLPTIGLTSDDDVLRSFEGKDRVFDGMRHGDLLVRFVIEYHLNGTSFRDEPPRPVFEDVVVKLEAGAADRRNANADQNTVLVGCLRPIVQFASS